MEKESLATGIRSDTIFGDLRFGMSEHEVYKGLNIYTGDYYRFDEPEIKNYKFNVRLNFYNDSLYRISFVAYSFMIGNSNLFNANPVVDVYKLKYNAPDTIILDNTSKDWYWFKGNKSINIRYSENIDFNYLSINYEDLSRNIFDRGLIRSEKDIFNVWTQDYYNNVYLPKKKKNLSGI